MREHSSAGSHGGSAALEEIHKYLSGYIVQACENQTQETHALFSFQKRCLNSDPWRSRRLPRFSICSPLFHFTAVVGFAGNGSPALSQQSGCPSAHLQ